MLSADQERYADYRTSRCGSGLEVAIGACDRGRSTNQPCATLCILSQQMYSARGARHIYRLCAVTDTLSIKGDANLDCDSDERCPVGPYGLDMVPLFQ